MNTEREKRENIEGGGLKFVYIGANRYKKCTKN